VAEALTYLYVGFLAHALFTFPSGRVSRPLEGLLVAGGYAVALLPPSFWAHDLTLVFVATLLASGLVLRYLTTARAPRLAIRYSTLVGTLFALALATKASLASWFQHAGVAFPSDPGTIAEAVFVILAFGLTWALLLLERRRLEATDLVVEIGEERGDPFDAPTGSDLSADPVFAAAVERAGALRSRNTSLQAELAGQVVALEASRRRLLEAGDDERTALEAVLRSGAMARLSDVAARLTTLAPGLGAVSPDARPHIDRATDQLTRTLADLDSLARGLDPGLLDERGLEGALRDLAERSPVPVELALDPVVRTPTTAVGATLYYVASEALANVARHAGAARTWMGLTTGPGGLELVVEDDGIGGAGTRSGGGLLGLRDRLDTLGGTLFVGARTGGGTRLAAWLPVVSASTHGPAAQAAVVMAGPVAAGAVS
jgi:signal transduction histidine kinase